jgi:DNA-binding MurR/RpiR family transcriptional regulator
MSHRGVTHDVPGDDRLSQDSDGTLLGRLASMPMSRAEERIIAYLLSIPEGDRALVTASEVATHSDTSRSTVDRLARQAGFAGFGQLRRSLVRDRGLTIPLNGAEQVLDPAILPTDEPEVIATKILGSVSSRTVAFGQMLLVDDRLKRVVAILDRARRIVPIGAGLSSMVAMDMHHRLLRLGLSVQYSEDAHTQLAFASLVGPEDAVVLVSYSGRTDLDLRAARIAAERGAHTIAITGDPLSPLARSVEVFISTPPGVGLFGNDAALTRLLQMMFSDVLFHCLALADPTRLGRAQSIDEILNTVKVLPGNQGRAGRPRTGQRKP